MRPAEFIWFVFSTGGVIAALLFFAGWFVMSPRSRRARLLCAAVAIGYAIVSVYPIPFWVGQQLGRPYRPLTRADVPTGRTAIVLLGSGSLTFNDWSGGAVSLPDPIGTERAIEAARAFSLIGADWLISSGGRVESEDPDEPASVSMRAVLIWLGVPDARIVIERDSRDTHDQALLVKRMLPTLGVDRVVLVTSGIHMRRSLAAFRRAGVEAIPAISNDRNAADIWMRRYLPSIDGLSQAGLVAHELLGLIYYRVRGWA